MPLGLFLLSFPIHQPGPEATAHLTLELQFLHQCSLLALPGSELGWCSVANRDVPVPRSCHLKYMDWHCPRKLEGVG